MIVSLALALVVQARGDAPVWRCLEIDADALPGSIAAGGDLDADGRGDVLMGVPSAVPWHSQIGGVTYRGFVGLVEGRSLPDHRLLFQHVEDRGVALEGLGWGLAFAGDVDGDGRHDVALGGCQQMTPESTGHLWTGRVAVVSAASGEALWVHDGEVVGGHLGSSLAVGADLTGDGLPEVLVGTGPGPAWGGGGFVEVLDGRTGELLARHLGANRIAAVGDADADGVPDLGLYWDPEGDRIVSGRTGEALLVLGGRVGELAGAGDVDGDGSPELLVVSAGERWSRGRVRARVSLLSTRSPSQPLWFVDLPASPNRTNSLGPCGDQDADGILDALFVGVGERDDLARLCVLSGLDGRVLQAHDLATRYGVAPAAPVDDLDGDGRPEIAVAERRPEAARPHLALLLSHRPR